MNNLEYMKSKVEELQCRINLLESMLNNVGAFIYAKDTTGNYTYVNQTVLDLFDVPLEQVIGKDDSYFFDLDKSNELKLNDAKVLSEGTAIVEEEHNFVKKSGETYIYKSAKAPIKDKQGQIIGMCGISSDITEEKHLQKVVREQKQLLDTVLDNVDAHIYMKNVEREFLYVNSKTAALFGRPVDEIIGRLETDLLPKEVADHFHKSDSEVFKTNQKQVINEAFTSEEGETFHYLSVKVPLLREGELPALIGFSSDVTELYRLKEEFRRQAATAPLTGLYNRRYFVEHAEKEFNRAKRHNHDLSLISLDIDYFKRINDTYGHLVGDSVLKALSNRLLPLIRREDIIARIGGEEFSIHLPNTSKNTALRIAERLRLEIDNAHLHGEVKATISLGVAGFDAETEGFDEMFKCADNALYQAKKAGRNRVS